MRMTFAAAAGSSVSQVVSNARRELSLVANLNSSVMSQTLQLDALVTMLACLSTTHTDLGGQLLPPVDNTVSEIVRAASSLAQPDHSSLMHRYSTCINLISFAFA